MSAVEDARPALVLTKAQVRLLALIVLLLVVAAFAVGYGWMTVKELTGQAVQGLIVLLGTLAMGGRR